MINYFRIQYGTAGSRIIIRNDGLWAIDILYSEGTNSLIEFKRFDNTKVYTCGFSSQALFDSAVKEIERVLALPI